MAQTTLLFLLFFFHVATLHSHAKSPAFSAIFIFGDSTVDTGNNNYITTIFRGNHRPYGHDFPDHLSSGRFSNGLLVSDLLSSSLGLSARLPPFLDPELSNDELRLGVSFASAASGYDDETSALSNAITISKQVELFKAYIERLKGFVGETEANKTVSNALIVASAGTNDMVLNYFDIPTRRLQFNISEYQDFILQRVQEFLKALYDIGGRNFIVTGFPPIGCLPVQMTAKSNQSSDYGCIEEQNEDVKVYNAKLKSMIQKQQLLLPASKILYQDLFDMLMDMLNKPSKYGFEETRKGCCGTGLFETGPACNVLTPLCGNISAYVFFDAIHPTEKTYRYVSDYIVEHVIPQFY